jgi:DNA-binding transcriptional MerR regulator
MEAKYLTAADAGRKLGLTPGAVRMMERRGELVAAEQTEGGVRLFLRSEVERVRLARRARTTEPTAHSRRRGGQR